MERDELIENLRTTLLWETVCAHIESRNEADVLLQKAGMENGVAAECAEIQDSEDFFRNGRLQKRRQESWIYQIRRAIRMVCMILRPWEKRNCCLSAALSAFLPLHTAMSNCWVC